MSLSTYNPSQTYAVMGLTTGMSFFNTAWGYMPFPKNFTGEIPPNSPKIQGLHPREEKLKELLQPGFLSKAVNTISCGLLWNSENADAYLKFDKGDLREKFLFLSAESDHNGALDPAHVLAFLKKINEKFDLKYQVMESFDEMCKAVKEASQQGKLTNVVIHAHGDFEGMCINHCNASLDGLIHQGRNFSECFDGLDTSGRITLFSGKTGEPVNKDPKNNIAQRIATAAKRAVIAPIIIVSSDKVTMPTLDHFEIFHTNPESWTPEFVDYSNVFKLFRPIYNNCPKAKQHRAHQREITAVETIKNEALEQSTLIQSTEFDDWQDVLNFCHDDPRKKFLFLSLEYDYNEGVDPQKNPNLFKVIAENYDMKFQVITSAYQICQAFQTAAKAGVFVEAVIHGHGNPDSMCILGKEKDCFHGIHKDHALANCLQGLVDSGKITLISCLTGGSWPETPNDKDNIASRIAPAIHRKVVAPDELSRIALIKIKSIIPFEISHPEEDNPNGNIFKTFN